MWTVHLVFFFCGQKQSRLPGQWAEQFLCPVPPGLVTILPQHLYSLETHILHPPTGPLLTGDPHLASSHRTVTHWRPASCILPQDRYSLETRILHLLLPLGSSSPLRSIQTANFLPKTLTVLQSGPSVIFVVMTGATPDSQLISPLLKPFHVPLMWGVVQSHASRLPSLSQPLPADDGCSACMCMWAAEGASESVGMSLCSSPKVPQTSDLLGGLPTQRIIL